MLVKVKPSPGGNDGIGPGENPRAEIKIPIKALQRHDILYHFRLYRILPRVSKLLHSKQKLIDSFYFSKAMDTYDEKSQCS